MAIEIFERFSSPSAMVQAEMELIALGGDAVPVLEALLSGQAKNDFGVPYKKLGLPLRCGLEVAIRLGVAARPLEALIRAELQQGDFVAAQALGALTVVEEESVIELAAHLNRDENRRRGFAFDLHVEAAAAIIRLGEEPHPAVSSALERSSLAATDFAKTKAFLKNRVQREPDNA